MVQTLKMYINGEWKDSNNKETINIINPANEQILAYAPKATAEETVYAIRKGKEAFYQGDWAERLPKERASVLNQIATLLAKHESEFVRLEVANNGKTMREAQADVEGAIQTFRYYANLLEQEREEVYEWDEGIKSLIVKEPIGVVGLIVPWNFPLLMSVWKLAPALAAGNSIILKPAEDTPLSAVRLFELLDQTDLPRGVAQLVMGTGSVVGQTMTESTDVDMISFTGSTDVGRTIMQAASGNLKKISLELGGKSPNIIFSDANLTQAIDYALFGIYMGAGQVCSSGSRILVEEEIYEVFVEKFIARAKQIKVGPGNDEASQMGAITSKQQMERILEYIKIGKKEGASLRLGGERLTKGELQKGYFIAPTVFTDVTSDMRIAQEEIFGPVVVIQPFIDEEEAIRIANSTQYGLAGAVFTEQITKAKRVIRKVKAGITWINTYHLTDVHAPWGGYKSSGIGRSLGTQGLEEYQEIKQINIDLNSNPINWF